MTIDASNQHVKNSAIRTYSPQQIAKWLRGEAKGSKILCPGPGHSPHDRSLSITIDVAAPDGFLVHSFAGDDPIMCRDYVRQQIGDDKWEPKPKASKRLIVAEYNYEDETGQMLFQAVRMQPKDFRQRRADGNGGWVWNLKGVRLVPYRLSELMEAIALERRVYIVEGEKDVEALRKLGLTATCNPTGAGKWRTEYAQYFQDADVAILPDNDIPGISHAGQIAKALKGIAASICICMLPGLADKGDVSDWIAAGGTAAKLEQLVTETANTPPDEPHVDNLKDAKKLNGSKPHFDWRSGTIPANELSKLEIPDVVWTIPQIMPEGVSILAAKPKVGKSWMTLAWCIAIASRRKDRDFIFDEDYKGIRPKHGSVLYLALEDNRRRMKSRLAKVCVESPEHLHINTEWPRCSQGGIEAIEEWIIDRTEAHKRGECPPPAFVAIDTLAKFRPPAKRVGDAYSQDYEAIEPLKKIADKYAISILIIHHQRKMESDDPFDSVSGTLGITGAADTIMIIARKDGGVVFMERGRDVEDEEIAIQFNRETGKWKALGSPSEILRSSNDKAILAVLKDAYQEAASEGERSLAIAEIKDRSGVSLSKPVFKNHILRMAKDGKIERAERGKYRHCLR
jgi:hypothetical protein